MCEILPLRTSVFVENCSQNSIDNWCECKTVYKGLHLNAVGSLSAPLAFDRPLKSFLPEGIPFLAYLDRILPQLGPEGLLYHQDRQECFDIYVIEQPLKAPAHTLPGEPEGLVDLFAVGAFEDHVAGAAMLQFHPEILQFGQPLEILQELRILLGQFHASSPLYPAHPARYRPYRCEPGTRPR